MFPEPCWTDVVGSNCKVQRVLPWPPAGIPGPCTSRNSGRGWGQESPKCPAADQSVPRRGAHLGRLGRHTSIPRPQLTFPAPRSLPCTSLRPPPPQPPPAPSSSLLPPRPGASGRPGCANPRRVPPPDAELGPARPRPLTSGICMSSRAAAARAQLSERARAESRRVQAAAAARLLRGEWRRRGPGAW